MRLCIFEDSGVDSLDPLTLTRPAFELRCGISQLVERQRAAFPCDDIGLIVRPELAELCAAQYPSCAVNDADWLRRGPLVLVNARWVPPRETLADLETPRACVVNGQLAYAVVSDMHVEDFSTESMDIHSEICKQTLRCCEGRGSMIDYPWDLVEGNADALRDDANWLRACRPWQRRIECVGPADNLFIADDAKIDPFVLADTTNGPVIIESGAVVQSFSRLEGPCCIGAGSWVLGAKLRGGSIGPQCRIGGEVEASIIQGYSNKYHDGFLGHSYLGEWVNLGAGTQVSDLRNDYGEIRVVIGDERIATGLHKVGVFLGDHTKTGLGTLLNSGTSCGAFANLLPTASYLPMAVPSFSLVRNGQIQELTDLRKIFSTTAKVMKRRGRELTGTHINFLFSLYEQTDRQRRRIIRDAEQRHWRKSV